MLRPLFVLLPACRFALEAPPVLRVPMAAQAPAIQAEAAEAVWRSAAVIPSLSPAIGGDSAALEPSEVRVLWGPKTLFVRFTCRNQEPWNPYVERDSTVYRGDEVHAFIQFDIAGAAYAEYQVGPQNQVYDALFLLTGNPVNQPTGRMSGESQAALLWNFISWDWAGTRQASKMHPDGQWIVDIAFDMGEYLARHSQTELIAGGEIRANFVRHEWPKPVAGERPLVPQYWSPVELGCPHLSPARMGTLTLVQAAADGTKP
jgi:hypothetical protein